MHITPDDAWFRVETMWNGFLSSIRLTKKSTRKPVSCSSPAKPAREKNSEQLPPYVKIVKN